MDSNLSASENAKRKLILAAMHLFAEDGVESVSLRMINREAGSKNNSALHYHFGNKLGLIEAVDNFIQDHFDVIREPQLSALEIRAVEGDIEVGEVMKVFTAPYREIIETFDWGYAAIRTIARMEFDGDDEVHKILRKSAGHAMKRFAILMRPLLPGVKPKLFKLRFNFVVNSTVQGFADYRNLHRGYLGDLSVKNLKELADFYADTGAAVLTAPS